MEISATIPTVVCQYLGIILVLVHVEVSGGLFQIQSKTALNDRQVTVYAGDTAVLRCEWDNSGPKEVIWRKVSQDFALSVGRMMYAPNDEMSIDYQETERTTTVNLVIKKTKPSHTGIYECQLISSEIKLRHVNLTVLSERPVLKQSITLDGSVYLSPNQRLNLTCNSTGTSRAPEYIDWFHNGNLIDGRKEQWRNRAVIISYKPEIPGRSLISILTVEHVNPADAGVYVCRSMTPSYNTGVDTTSIIVHILNSEKDHMKKREGDNKKAQELTKDYSSLAMQTNGCYKFILLVILSQLLTR